MTSETGTVVSVSELRAGSRARVPRAPRSSERGGTTREPSKATRETGTVVSVSETRTATAGAVSGEVAGSTRPTPRYCERGAGRLASTAVEVSADD